MHTILPLLGLTILSATPAAAQSPLEGVWTSPKGNVTVRIAPCGKLLCGRVIDASARSRRRAAKQGVDRLVGEPLLNNIEAIAPGKWKGRVHVPRVNTHVAGRITMQGRDRMEVSGCYAAVLCRSAVWKRIS